MSNDEVLQAAGEWYRDVLVAVGVALDDVGMPTSIAARFVQSLACQGFTIERTSESAA